MSRAHNGIIHLSLVFFLRIDVISFHGELKVLKGHENARLFISQRTAARRMHSYNWWSLMIPFSLCFVSPRNNLIRNFGLQKSLCRVTIVAGRTKDELSATKRSSWIWEPLKAFIYLFCDFFSVHICCPWQTLKLKSLVMRERKSENVCFPLEQNRNVDTKILQFNKRLLIQNVLFISLLTIHMSTLLWGQYLALLCDAMKATQIWLIGA